MPNPRPAVDRFHEKYERVPWSGCWIWTARVGGKGYGYMSYEQGSQCEIGAHRISWLLHRGEIPEGRYVCHRCDVPSCVNPDHLFLGTALENKGDCDQKGRARYVTRRGEASNKAKLTVEAVLDIRSGTQTSAEYARKYGVTPSTIRYVKRRQSWSHI